MANILESSLSHANQHRFLARLNRREPELLTYPSRRLRRVVHVWLTDADGTADARFRHDSTLLATRSGSPLPPTNVASVMLQRNRVGLPPESALRCFWP